MGQAEHDLARRIFHDRIIDTPPAVPAIKQLVGELMGQRKMQSKAARLIEIFGYSGRHKLLKFVNIYIERFTAFGFASFFRGCPKVA